MNAARDVVVIDAQPVAYSGSTSGLVLSPVQREKAPANGVASWRARAHS